MPYLLISSSIVFGFSSSQNHFLEGTEPKTTAPFVLDFLWILKNIVYIIFAWTILKDTSRLW